MIFEGQFSNRDTGPFAECEKFLERLREAGVPVTVACWLKSDDSGRWYLYIVTPLVAKNGALKAAYRRAHAVIQETEPPLGLDQFSFHLISAHDPVAKALLALRERHPGGRPLHLGPHRFAHLPVEEVYMYPQSDDAAVR